MRFLTYVKKTILTDPEQLQLILGCRHYVAQGSVRNICNASPKLFHVTIAPWQLLWLCKRVYESFNAPPIHLSWDTFALWLSKWDVNGFNVTMLLQEIRNCQCDIKNGFEVIILSSYFLVEWEVTEEWTVLQAPP